jgi:hypothetical protein
MNLKSKRITTIVALLVVLSISQVLVTPGFAAPSSGVLALPVAVQDISGVLATSGNKPIKVNDQSALTGATILSGATIETPDQVTATVAIPGKGTVEVQANTKFTVTFDATSIKINLIHGCLVLITMKGVSGEIDNAQGVLGITNGVNEGRLETCPNKATPVAAAAGAGGLLGIGTAATIAIVGGGIAAVAAIALSGGSSRGSNPSPFAP